MGASADNNSGPITSINVTPLVDVVLVILIIFMATAPLLQKKALNVNVPKAANPETKATATLQVQYTADKQITIEGDVFALGAVAQELKRRMLLDAALHVAIAADQGLPYGEVVELLDVIRGAGVKKVALEVKQKARPPS